MRVIKLEFTVEELTRVRTSLTARVNQINKELDELDDIILNESYKEKARYKKYKELNEIAAIQKSIAEQTKR